MSKKGRKFMSMLIGFGLISILLYSLVYLITVTTPSLAIPPKQSPTPPPPTPTRTPTPTPPPGTPTPTPTPTPPPTGGRLEIQTIPQDDQLRKKGIIILDSPADFHAEYKIDIRQDGINVDTDSLECIVLHKQVCNPKVRQPGLITEEELTEVTDFSDSCVCLFQQAPGVPGVGVIDLFCEFPDAPFFWGDYILKVVAEVDGVVGSEIQDLCVLEHPTCFFFDTCQSDFKDPGFRFDIPGGNGHTADAIFPFSSCKNAALFQATRNNAENLPQCTFQ